MAYKKKKSGSEKRKRGPIVLFRVSEEERAKIQALAERAGLTVGSYVRSRALAKPTTRAVRRPPVETQQLAQLLGMLGAVGGAVQKITGEHGAAGGVDPAEAQAALESFREAAAAILQTMGKRPSLPKGRGQ
jgi:hypothetical protein